MSGLIHVGAWDGHEYIGDPRRLLLFEPQREAFAQLKRNMSGRDNVTLWRCACGARQGTAVMHSSQPSDNSSILKPTGDFVHSGRTIHFEGTELVVLTTLDAATSGLAAFDELVIDTQGYELEVLRGAKRTLTTLQSVSLEIHDPNVYPDAATLDQVLDFMCDWSHEIDEEGSPGVCDVRFYRSS